MTFIFKSENVVISSLGTLFTHGLGITPAGRFGETRLILRVAAAASAAVIVSLSNSVTVTIQSQGGNNVQADVVCQVYHPLIA